MGSSKQKWTEEEEVALRAGVMKHGVGKWRAIQKDPCFQSALSSRTNVDLKDKWRNLTFDPQLSPGKKAVVGEKRGRAKVPEVSSGRGRKIPYSGTGNFVDGYAAKRYSVHSPNETPIGGEPTEHSACTDEIRLPGGVDGVLSRLEDAAVAAIIGLNSPNGSTVAEISEWLQENCPSRRGGALKGLQAILSKLVAQRRLGHGSGRYRLAGYVIKYAREEEMELLTESGSRAAPVSATLAAVAAKAVLEAEEAAFMASRLSQEADMLEAQDTMARKEPNLALKTHSDDMSDSPSSFSNGIDMDLPSNDAKSGANFMMFGASQGVGQLIASV